MQNQKKIISCFTISFFLLFTGCGKEKIEAGSPEEVLSFVRDRGNSEIVLGFYTTETVSLMRKYMKLTGMKRETSVDILSFIPEGAEYKITEKKIEGNSCYLVIVFTKHSSENAIGQPMALKMEKEKNSWKIDRKDDFIKLIESYESKKATDYMNRIK